MSMSNTLGTRLVVNDKDIGRLTSIGGVSVSADNIDVTNFQSEGGFREKLRNLMDADDVSFSGFFDGDNEGQTGALAQMASAEVVPCKIVFPPKIGYTWKFNGYINKFGTSFDLGDAVKMDGSLAVSGKPELVETESATENS